MSAYHDLPDDYPKNESIFFDRNSSNTSSLTPPHPQHTNTSDDKHVSNKREVVDVILDKFSISINMNATAASLSMKNIDILHPLSTLIKGGSMFAILGGSGSGKTTLLNVIANRYDRKSFTIGGTIHFSGVEKCSIGYVTQQDFLLPFLTVYETLMFAARLKLNTQLLSTSGITSYESIVEHVIADLGLRECTNNFVGDSNISQISTGNRGLSGGERRRVSIAIQIISDPQGRRRLIVLHSLHYVFSYQLIRLYDYNISIYLHAPCIIIMSISID